MTTLMLTYSEIPLYSENAIRGEPVSVRLSRFRGWLYSRMVSREIRFRERKASMPIVVGDLILMLMVLMVSKRLILLAYYHPETLASYKAIDIFRKDKEVIVTFNRSSAGISQISNAPSAKKGSNISASSPTRPTSSSGR